MILARPRIHVSTDQLNLTSEKPYVVLAGLDCLQGLQTARLLAQWDVPVIGLIGNPDLYFGHTHVCEAILQTPREENGLEQVLIALRKQPPQKVVLIACTDAHVWDVSETREQFAEWYHIALPDHETLELLIDKEKFLKFALEQNLSIPKTYFLNNREEAVQVAEEISYPAVIKPPFRSASFGDDKSLYSCNCYFNQQNEPLATFTARKIRQYPPRTGQSALGEEVRADEVLEETIRLFRSVNYWGLGYLEMKRDDKSGKYFIVEPNIGRPTGRSAIAEAGGVNILYTMYCDLVGLPLPTSRTQSYGDVKWIHLLRDMKSAYFYWREGELSLSEWLSSMRGRKYFAVLSLKDPRPFISALIATLSPNSKV